MQPHCRSAHIGLAAAILLFCAAIAALLLRSHFEQRPVAFAEPGNPAPSFNLHDADGRFLSLDDLRGSAAVLYFTSIHCPNCAAYNPRIQALANRYRSDPRVRFVAINIDPGTDPLQIRVDAKVVGRSFPTLIDDKTVTATAYSITTTPQVAVIDPVGTLRYRGPFDDNASESKVTAQYVADTLAGILAHPELAFATK